MNLQAQSFMNNSLVYIYMKQLCLSCGLEEGQRYCRFTDPRLLNEAFEEDLALAWSFVSIPICLGSRDKGVCSQAGEQH